MGKRISVMLGANLGCKKIFAEKAEVLARQLCLHGCTLVYGGGRLGLMGVLADAMLNLGGEVIGVSTPELFAQEGHLHLSQIHMTHSMFERKQKMLELSDACIALPGGVGTLDEILDFWNLYKMGLSTKPVGLFNVEGYYDLFLSFIHNMIQNRFLDARHVSDLLVSDDPSELIAGLIEGEPIRLIK